MEASLDFATTESLEEKKINWTIVKEVAKVVIPIILK